MTTTTALSMPQCAWPSGGVSDLSKLAHECRPPALVGSKLDDKVTNNILPTPNLRGHCRVPIGGRLSLSLSLSACMRVLALYVSRTRSKRVPTPYACTVHVSTPYACAVYVSRTLHTQQAPARIVDANVGIPSRWFSKNGKKEPAP